MPVASLKGREDNLGDIQAFPYASRAERRRREEGAVVEVQQLMADEGVPLERRDRSRFVGGGTKGELLRQRHGEGR